MGVVSPPTPARAAYGGQRLCYRVALTGIIPDPASSLVAIEVSRADMWQQPFFTGTDCSITARTNLAAGFVQGRPKSGSAAMQDDGPVRDFPEIYRLTPSGAAVHPHAGWFNGQNLAAPAT
jgi:hypothetical protein